MKKTITLASYRERVMRVVDYLWHHLEDDLDANQLSEIACFSSYHFQRIYREMMHETLRQTLKRLRLHRAACTLSRDSTPIADIAQQTGYGSAEAFTRAFTAYYGQTPSRFRTQRFSPDAPALSLPPLLKDYPMSYNVSIETVDVLSMGGMHHKGDYLAIGSTFDQLFALAQSHNLVDSNTRSFGVYFDDPGATEMRELRSMACITLSTAAAEHGLTAIEIGGGEHAVLTYTGPYSDLESVYAWFYGSWLPNSGREAREAPPAEEYINDPHDTPPAELITKIYLPLK
ncbi:AraC family transcriptional regulator [Gilvimarinus sp. SDUM040013]|uniref:AraC family transcriptional regulator n=1 Tax=Gilvimarinus gilvus TaxID=3058038 RepID=A0ABU4S096_9GAMM|nr:AraC family transcriptional regulator [Gilvimarinus sp. SDUM040013]MDO3387965.1 AraC family transcriptional regulator [Gilvimarinus sp. SDUM040013]MDX6848664.1 AraC family transcriptional regulator [Gilvimarinus sp. SDUM040013]